MNNLFIIMIGISVVIIQNGFSQAWQTIDINYQDHFRTSQMMDRFNKPLAFLPVGPWPYPSATGCLH